MRPQVPDPVGVGELAQGEQDRFEQHGAEHAEPQRLVDAMSLSNVSGISLSAGTRNGVGVGAARGDVVAALGRPMQRDEGASQVVVSW